MQPLKLIVIGLLISFAATAEAQVSIRVNIGMPPPWGPQVEDDVRYYYLPDVDAYYDINTSLFICFYNGHWVHRRHLPDRYQNYDLYHGRKIVVNNYRGNTPYSHCNYHKNRDYRIIKRSERSHHRDYEDHYRRSDKNHGEGNMKFARGKGKGKGRKD
jgi:hypothetical protein